MGDDEQKAFVLLKGISKNLSIYVNCEYIVIRQ